MNILIQKAELIQVYVCMSRLIGFSHRARRMSPVTHFEAGSDISDNFEAFVEAALESAGRFPGWR